jgi:hypothetical protein
VATPHLELPDDFEYESYKAVSSRIGPLHESHQLQWREYSTAWEAVAIRFLTCAEHDEAFTRSVTTHGDAPQQPERYFQERDLFGFFVTGLPTIESACYGLYAIASMLDDVNFPIKEAKDKRAIKPESTAMQFRKAFPNEAISRALKGMVDSQEYKDWNKVRNILAHRGWHARTIYASTVGSGDDTHGDALWLNGIPLNASTTPSRRAWLAGTLQTLLREAHSFARTKEF